MDDKIVSGMLKEEAIKYGLCVAWADEWGSPTKEQLVDMYIRGLDFCIVNNYPSNEYIKEHFGVIAEAKGVFTDAKIDLHNPVRAILNGGCSGTIVLSGFASVDIHVRHTSRVKVIVRDFAKAFVRVYDSACVTIENEGNSRSFLYNKECKGVFTLSGNVRVRNYRYDADKKDWVLITNH